MLVWEDGYCRPGFVDMSYEWDALRRKSGDPLCQQRSHGGSLEILVFRLMFNQVHALGDGYVDYCLRYLQRLNLYMEI